MSQLNQDLKIKNRQTMPVLFIGHGSPMNAINENNYTRTLNALGERLARPKAILCISAHWLTEQTTITHMQKPKTIHDFYGFPQELFDITYPANGAPALAEEIQKAIQIPKILTDDNHWGLDHGTWSVLVHLYPQADIPVLQLSININQAPLYHYQLGQELQKFRDKGVLIIGSGNIVHNLQKIKWQENATPFDWAITYDAWVKQKIETRDFANLVNDFASAPEGRLAVPTPEHYYPLLYILGASRKSDVLKFEYEEIQNGSISMRSLGFYTP